MNNKAKAREIALDEYMPDTGFSRDDIEECCLEMATWKDEQLKKKLDEIIEIGESNYARGNKIDMLKELLNL